MGLAEQIAQIQALAAQGESPQEIAAAVGVEMGDVQSVLGGGLATAAAAAAADPSGVLRVISYPFAHDTPDLHNGVPIYTPKVGDVLLDAWIEVVTAWNGTTPFADLGIFTDLAYGWWSNAGSGIDLSVADVLGNLDHAVRNQSALGNGVASSLSTAFIEATGISSHWGQATRSVPATFVRTDPVKVVVSQDGSTAAAASGSTQGSATAFLMVATP